MNPDSVAALRAGGDPHVGADGRVPHGSSDDPDVLDFSANTNPLVPPGTRAVFERSFDAVRSYPDDGYPDFRAATAEFVDCAPEQVVPTAGGLEAIRLAIGTTVRPGESVLLPAPSFGEYAREVGLQGAEAAFFDHDAILDADPADHTMAVVCNPNNPTGTCYDADALRAFADRCGAAGTTLLVDEAFLGFTDEPSLAGREGVLVARSLTKLFGLPGVRMGYAVGTHCYGADEFVAETRERVARERERMRERLETRFDVFPSEAPFLCFDTGETAVDDLLATAREDGIALRDARTFRRLDSHVRVAVRLPDANDRLLEALDV